MTPTQTRIARMTLRRSVAGVLAAGAVLTGTAGVIGAGIALTAGPASAGPAEDCAAVRARDHQIYLNLIASLPPGAPIPPEYINPCLTAPSTTATAAPTTTVGLPGAQAPGGGPNVGANAPTNFPTYNGTPIVPIPTIEVPPIASESPTSETGAGAFPDASTPQVPSPTLNPTPGEGATPDRRPGPVPAATPNSVPEQQESTPSVTTSGLDEDDGRDRYLELALVGAAAFTAGGIGVRGRRTPFSSKLASVDQGSPDVNGTQVFSTKTDPLVASTAFKSTSGEFSGPSGGFWVTDYDRPLANDKVPAGPYANSYIPMDPDVDGNTGPSTQAIPLIADPANPDALVATGQVQYRFRVVGATATTRQVVQENGEYYLSTYYSYRYEVQATYRITNHIEPGLDMPYSAKPGSWESITYDDILALKRKYPDAIFYIPKM